MPGLPYINGCPDNYGCPLLPCMTMIIDSITDLLDTVFNIGEVIPYTMA
jgi:hypothetical protein